MLDETLGAATSDDVVVLSFAGHGTPDHRFVVSDSVFSNLAASTLDMGELATRFRESKARTVICLLDCCFSGGAPARVLENAPIPRGGGIPLTEIVGRGRILLAASNTDEPALEDPISRHGLFTKAVIDGLLVEADSVSIIGLVDAVVRNVRAAAARFGEIQTPVMFGHVEGEVSLPALVRGQRYPGHLRGASGGL